MASSSDLSLVLCNRTTTNPHRRLTQISGADHLHLHLHHRLHPDPVLRSSHEEEEEEEEKEEEEEEDEEEEPPAPMTFFYGGRVHVFHGISRRQARALALLLSGLDGANDGSRATNHGITMEAMSWNHDAITEAGSRMVEEDNAEEAVVGRNGRIRKKEAVSSSNVQGIEDARRPPEEGRPYPGSYLLSGGPGPGPRSGPGPGPGGGYVPMVALSALRRRSSLARFLKSRCR